MPTGNATIRFLLPEVRLEIDVEDVGLQLDTCADSTQTLGDMFNDLKLPLEQDEGYQALRSSLTKTLLFSWLRKYQCLARY